MCLGTNVHVSTQTWLWPHDYNMPVLKCVWAQTCVGTIVCGHNRVGSSMYGHKRVWAQTCVGTIVCGHNRVGSSMYGHKRVVSVRFKISDLNPIENGNKKILGFPFFYIFYLFFLLYFQYWKWSMVTETFTNKNEIKNFSPHYNWTHIMDPCKGTPPCHMVMIQLAYSNKFINYTVKHIGTASLNKFENYREILLVKIAVKMRLK